MWDFERRFGCLLLIFLGLFSSHPCYCCNGFVVISDRNNKTRRTIRCTTPRVNNNNNNDNNNEEISSYEETDGASKGFVSSLTGIVNTFTKIKSNDGTTTKTSSSDDNNPPPPPMEPNELLNRIRDDYIVNNYLWTGDIDFECFEETCKFTDPTLSFEGTDTFRTNTQNLVPFIQSNVENPQSILLDIQLTNEYVETRWNMKGDVTGLFWKPKIDVIGRTKFWFRRRQQRNDDNGNNNEEEDSPLGIYFYDEKWEIPAYKALLQLVTPTKGGGSN